MPVTLNDIVRIVPKMNIRGDLNLNTFHFKVLLAGHVSDADFMTRVAVLIDNQYQIINVEVAAGLAYDNIEGQNITKNELLPTQLWPVLVLGANVGDELPHQVTATVFFRTLRPKTRASKQFGGYTESASDNVGNLDLTAKASLQTLGNNLVTGLTDGVVTIGYGAYNSALARFTAVNAAIVVSTWGTRKSRRPGVGG